MDDCVRAPVETSHLGQPPELVAIVRANRELELVAGRRDAQRLEQAEEATRLRLPLRVRNEVARVGTERAGAVEAGDNYQAA